MKRILFLMVVIPLLLVGCGICPPCPVCTPCPGIPTPTVGLTSTPEPTGTPIPNPVLWEPFLDIIHVGYERVPNARYELVAVWHTLDGSWEGTPKYAQPYITVNGGGGDTHMFAIVFKANGDPLVGKSVVLSWPDGQDARVTWDDGSANFFCPAKYFPDQGQQGPYSLQPLNGDILRGGGLPYGQHVSIFGVWRERQGYEPTLMERLGLSR